MLEVSHLRLYLLTFRNANPSYKFHRYLMYFACVPGRVNRGDREKTTSNCCLHGSNISVT